MTLFRKSYFYIVFALIMLFLLNMRVEAFNDTTLNYPIWLQHIADDFEVEVDLLVPLYSSGMDYRQIKEKMFEAASVEDVLPQTSDFIALAAEKDIENMDAVRAYELGVKYKKDPSWLADLYKRYRDWDEISEALDRYTQTGNALTSVPLGYGYNAMLQTIGSVYNVASSFLTQLYNVFSDAEDIRKMMFFYDLNKEDYDFISGLFSGLTASTAEAFLGMEEIAGLRTSWPPVTISLEELATQTEQTRSLNLSFASEPAPQQFTLRSLSDQPDDEPQTYDTTSSSQDNMFDMGLIYGADKNSPFKSYFTGSSESVDSLSGELTMAQTDFTLPGKYGMDFNFTRIYRSTQAFFKGPVTWINVSGYSVNNGSVQQVDTYRQENPDGSVVLDTYTKEYTYPSQTSTNGMAVGTLTETLTRAQGYVDQYGVDQYQSTQQVSQETYQNVMVSPASSDITTQYASSSSSPTTTEISYLYKCFGFGVGWALDIPVMEIASNVKYIHLGSEGTYIVYTDGYLYGRNLKDLRVQDDTSYTYGDETSSYSLTNVNGKVWYFNSSGRPMAQKDKYDSYIRYFYNDKGYIDNIVDTVGRRIQFTYTYSHNYTNGQTVYNFPGTIVVTVYDSTSASAQSLFSWTYTISNTTTQLNPCLTSVQPPTGPAISFMYTLHTGQIQYGPYEDRQYIDIDYMSMTSVQHPNGTVSSYEYNDHIDLPHSYSIGTAILTRKEVKSRVDTVPTEVVTSSGITVQNKQENKATFYYCYPVPGHDRETYTTKTLYRNTGESGIVSAVEKFKYNTENRLIEHTLTTENGGEELNQPENITTTYEYDADRKSLPIKQTVTTTVNNNTSTKVHNYVWDDYRNQVMYKDPAGYITEYEYDQTYNMMTRKTEHMTPNDRTGKSKVTEYVLDEAKKNVVTVKETMVNQTALVQKSVDGPLGTVEEGSPVTFVPGIPVKGFSATIRVGTNIMSSCVYYNVSYRKIGAQDWTTVGAGYIYYYSPQRIQTKTYNITFPEEDYYEIKITRQYGHIFDIQEFKVYYDEMAPTDVTQVIKTLEYDPNHPGNVVSVNTHQIISGSPSSVIPPVESRTTYQYDSTWHTDLVEEATTVTDVDGIQSVIKTTAQYDRLGRPTSMTRQSSADLSVSQTSMEYDLLGRLTKVVNPPHDDTVNTTYRIYTYFDSQRKIRITDELGNVTEETYDGMDRLVTSSWIDSLNQIHMISHNRYDSLGRLVSSFDGNFNETKYEYDAFGRKVKTILPDETYKTTSYSDVWTDPNEYPVISLSRPSHINGLSLDGWGKTVNEDGSIAYSGYDVLGRTVVSAGNPDPAPTNGSLAWNICWYEYDSFNRITKMSIQRQQNVWDTTQYEYEYGFSSPSSIDLPGETEPKHIYEYNSMGLMTREHPSDISKSINYQYDELGRLKRIDYPDNVTAKYKADKFGNTVSAQLVKNGAVESIVAYQYNERNWLKSQQWTIGSDNYTISYEYDSVGNRKKVTYPDNVEINFEYDELGRIVKIPGLFESSDALTLQNRGFIYDPAGNLTNTYAVNGVNTAYTYNARNKVTNITSPPLTLGYSYTNSGNVLSVTSSTSGTSSVTLQYTYDKAGQLKTAQVVRDNTSQTLKYTYDGAGNRVYEELLNASNQLLSSYQYTYLPGNYLSQRGGQTTLSYSWGTFGQLTYKSTGDQYIYDATKSLVSVQNAGTQLANYKYDALGNRIVITEEGTTTTVLTSGNDAVYEIVSSASGDLTTSKYVIVNGKHLAKIVKEGSGSPQKLFHHVDLAGSVRAVTDINGQVVERYDYDPFGYMSSSSGNGDETHLFTGKRADSGTGLTYFGSRYYDPEIGRFISSDPAKWGTNWYIYCYNNPIAYIDPDGMKPSDSSEVLSQSKYTTQYDTNKAAKKGFVTVGGIIATLWCGEATIPLHLIGWTGAGALAIEDYYESLNGGASNEYLVNPLQYDRFLKEAEPLYRQYVKRAETIRATLDAMYAEGIIDYETMALMKEWMMDADEKANQLAKEIADNTEAFNDLKENAAGKWTGR